MEAEVAALDALRSGLGVACVGPLTLEAGGVHVSLLRREEDSACELSLVLDDPDLYPSCSGRFACADPVLSERLAGLNAALAASGSCRVGAALASLGRALDLDLEWADVLSKGGPGPRWRVALFAATRLTLTLRARAPRGLTAALLASLAAGLPPLCAAAQAAGSSDEEGGGALPLSPTFSTGEVELSRKAVPVLEEEPNVCSICLDEFVEADPGVPTRCRHSYHLQCIMQWAQRSRECPLCFRTLRLEVGGRVAAVERAWRGSLG